MRRISDFLLMAFCSAVWGLLGMLSAMSSPQMQVREQNQSRKRQNKFAEDDCLFNARSPYIQCAVNPTEVCDIYVYFVEYEEWKY